MRASDDGWWSVRAAEYVIGTLDARERSLFERILRRDVHMRADVARWTRWFAPLDALVSERRPGAHVWTNVAALVAADIASADGPPFPLRADAGRLGERPSALPAPPHAPFRASPSRSRRLPSLALAATSMAAGVLLGAGLPRFVETTDGRSMRVDTVAVVSSDTTGLPLFHVATDHRNLRVRVTALAPPPLESGDRFQLWQALPDRSAVRPVASLPARAGVSRVLDIPSLVDGSDLFGVSVEPAGASTAAGPTGPVIAHGDALAVGGD